MEQKIFLRNFYRTQKIPSLQHVKESFNPSEISLNNCEKTSEVFLIIFWFNNVSNVWNLSNVEQILRIRLLVTSVENELKLEPRLFKTSSLLVQTTATVCSELTDNFIESFFNSEKFSILNNSC